ncbi:MAG: LapA family protein [Deltaproteobacteria bacterium]|nr:LapA family protein [Deltaproteobacteria bacterium]
MNIKLIAGLILICLIVIFSIQNTAVVEIKLFFWTISMSRVLLMFLLLAIGIFMGWLLSSYSMHRKKDQSTEEY